MRAGQAIVIGILVALLGASIWYAYEGWAIGENIRLPSYVYAAMALGAAFSIVIGGGLMALLFFSSHRGYDEPPRRIAPRNDSHENKSISP